MPGVPHSDREFFHERAAVTNSRTKTPEESAENVRLLGDYIAGLVRQKTDDPGEDVLTDLAEKVAEGDLDIEEAKRLGTILLVAGHDTSANMITGAAGPCGRR